MGVELGDERVEFVNDELRRGDGLSMPVCGWRPFGHGPCVDDRILGEDFHHVRALGSKDFDSMLVSEVVPVIGVALESHKPRSGLIWVLVNPQ